MTKQEWVVTGSSLFSTVLLCLGAYVVDGFIRETRDSIAELTVNTRERAPLRLIFEWTGPAGTQRLETTREDGETFTQFLERHRLYVRLALED